MVKYSPDIISMGTNIAMEMFATFKRLTGQLTVEEKNGIITVEGVRADVMAKDIFRVWNTNRINSNMFIHQDSSSFSFPSAFAPDVYFILDSLTQQHSVDISVRTLTKIKNLLRENTWLANTIKEYPCRLNFSRLSELTLTPLDFQSDFVKVYDQRLQAYNLKGFLFAATAGSGKTFTSLMLANLYDIDVVFVVCPSNAVQKVWEENILKRFKVKQKYWHSRMNTEPTGKERFVVCHYESLDKLMVYAARFVGKKTMIVLDESHNLNEVSSKRTNVFIDLCKQTSAEHIIWLSGTPIKALPKESIPLFRCIDPLFTPDVEERFKKIFGSSNVRGVEILNHRLGIVTYLVEKKQLNLLQPIFKEIKVKMPNSHEYTLDSVKKKMQDFIVQRNDYYKSRKKEDERYFYSILDWYETNHCKSKGEKSEYLYYREALKTVIRSGGDYWAKQEIMYCNKFENTKIIPLLTQENKNKFKDIRSIIKYVALKIQGECLGRIVGGLRTQCHVDMVPYIDFVALCESTNKKVVVFTDYVSVVEKSMEIMKKSGLNPVAVYGKTSSNLSHIVTQFGTDDSQDPLVATYKSLSTAVPLTMCDTAVMLNAPFRDYVLQQAVSRVHRLDADSKNGQTQTYIFTVSLDTGELPNISTRNFDILKWSQEQVQAIIGIKSPFEIGDNPESLTLALECELFEDIRVSVKNDVPKYTTLW